MATTGNTTLMVVAVTPRVLVLAWLTGVPLALFALATSAAPAAPGLPGVPEGARATQASSATTMASTMTAVRTCMARGRRRSRRQERPNGARGWCNAPRGAETSVLVPILTLLRRGLDRRPPRWGPRP